MSSFINVVECFMLCSFWSEKLLNSLFSLETFLLGLGIHNFPAASLQRLNLEGKTLRQHRI